MLHSLLLISALAMSVNSAELVAQLQSQDPAQRSAAAEALCRMGADAQGAIVPLVTATGDTDEQTQQWANAALEEIGPPAAADIPQLCTLLKTEQTVSDVAYWAATLLGRLEESAGDAVPALAQAAEEHYALAVRERAVWALGKIGPGAAAAQPVLEKLSSSEQPRLAKLAASSLSKVKSSAE